LGLFLAARRRSAAPREGAGAVRTDPNDEMCLPRAGEARARAEDATRAALALTANMIARRSTRTGARER